METFQIHLYHGPSAAPTLHKEITTLKTDPKSLLSESHGTPATSAFSKSRKTPPNPLFQNLSKYPQFQNFQNPAIHPQIQPLCNPRKHLQFLHFQNPAKHPNSATLSKSPNTRIMHTYKSADSNLQFAFDILGTFGRLDASLFLELALPEPAIL